MTYLDDYLKKLKEEQGGAKLPSEVPETTVDSSVTDLKPNVLTSGLRSVEAGGGALLTKTVTGLSMLGQGVLGFVHSLETDGTLYDQEQRPGEKPKANNFDWRQLDGAFERAFEAGKQQSKRVLASDNLTEFGQNALTGADILKALPGSLGEDFRNESRGSKNATFVLGLGLELFLDPIGKVGKGVQFGAKTVTGAAKMGSKAADITTRLVTDAATGNWVAGPIAMGLRETSLAVRGKLQNIANDPTRGVHAAKAAGLLENLYGPMSLASQTMKPVLNQYAALKEELPKQMQRAADMAAVATSGIPKRHRTQAQNELAVMASNPVGTEAREQARENLIRLGMKPERVDAIGKQFFEANSRIVGLLAQGVDTVPGLTFDLSPDHVRQTYRMFQNSKIVDSHLDALVAANTPGSFQIAQTHLRDRLEEALGLRNLEVTAKPGQMANRGNDFLVGRQGEYAGGSLSQKATKEIKVANTGRDETARSNLRSVDKGAAKNVGVQTSREAAFVRTRADELTKQIEAIDTQMAKLNPTNSTGVTSSNGPLGKLAVQMYERKAKLTARLDELTEKLDNVNILENRGIQGLDINTVGGFTGAGGTLKRGTMDPKNQLPGPIEGVEGKTAWNKKLHGADRRLIDNAEIVSPELRATFLDELASYMDHEPFQRNRVAGFKFDEQGVPRAQFHDPTLKGPDGQPIPHNGEKGKARQQSLAQITEFVDDFALRNNLDETAKITLQKNTINSLVYVDGSNEFARGVRDRKGALKSIGDMRKFVENHISTETSVAGADLSVIAMPTIDPVFQPLLGKIDEFTPRVAEQATEVGGLTAEVVLRTEMKKRGLVKSAEEISKLPEAEKLGWTEMSSKVFGQEGLYAHATNMRAIEAINRSTGDTSTGALSKGLQAASNLFRSAALVTDPSAHATQYMGNLAMLKMMGYDEMFTNTPRFARDIQTSARSILMTDEVYQDAVDAGVQISQTVLNEGARARSVNAMLNQPLNVDGEGAVKAAFQWLRTAGDQVGHSFGTAVERNLTSALERTGRTFDEANAYARQTISPTSQFQMADQLTRMYAYKHTIRNKTDELVKANPWLTPYRSKETGMINFKSLDEFNTKQAEKGLPGISTADEIEDIKTAYRVMREEAAQISNDVALNYSDVPLAVTQLSRSGVVPFIKFQYKATGRIMEWFDEKPWVFSPFYQAQTNANAAFSDDPDKWEQAVHSLSPTVRDGLVLPTGVKNENGMPEFIDTTRWLPFGMFAQAAGGGQAEFDTGRPSSLVSTPIVDMYTALTTDEGRKEGQSKYAFMAGKLAENFAPSGWGAGGRRMDSLARAIEQSAFYVDGEGNVVEKEKTPLEKFVVGYNSIPEKIGATVGNAVGDVGTATGARQEQEFGRGRTTVREAAGRFFAPGYGFASDPEMTFNEISNTIDRQVQDVKTKINALEGQTMMTDSDIKQIERWNKTIEQLAAYKERQLARLHLGE